MVNEEYSQKKKNKKFQQGGVLPLVAIGTAAAAALASKIVGDLCELVKKENFRQRLKNKP